MIYERFILNSNDQDTSGQHELHRATCVRLPAPWHQINIGNHSSSQAAQNYARQLYPNWNIDGCAYCCPEINHEQQIRLTAQNLFRRQQFLQG